MNVIKRQRGFTIVELLIVIVVIAILAAISVVAYNGIQNRAQDSKRAQDFSTIKKALISYDQLNGGVKRVTAYTTSSWGGWDSSINPDWLSFLRSEFGKMPTDPVNKMATNNAPETSNRGYYYYCYPAGQGTLPATANVRIGYIKSNGTGVTESFPVSECKS